MFRNKRRDGPCKVGGFPSIRESVKRPGSLTKAVKQARFAKHLEMTRHARLTLTEDLGQFGHRELRARTEGKQPQTRRLGSCTQYV